MENMYQSTVIKKRTRTPRRPKPDYSSLSPSPRSDGINNVSSDDNSATKPRKKEVNVNQFVNGMYSRGRAEASKARGNNKGEFNHFHNNVPRRNPASNKRSSEGVLAPANWKKAKTEETTPDHVAEPSRASEPSETKVKKMKLKVGGVTRTIEANSKGLQPLSWKGFSKGNDETEKKEDPLPARKSKRVPKKRTQDGEFDDDYEDEEIRYLEKLKGPKLVKESEYAPQSHQKHRKLSSVSKITKTKGTPKDTDCEDVSDSTEGTRNISLTTRQRALQSSKDGASSSAANLIEFPNGLPPVPRKQKEKLSETEQQLKKAEAAERRRLQNEKAARESEAEAIRRILGQDSGRKKREEKIKKRQQEMAQEKAENLRTVPPNTIRWVMGPSGTSVTFPSDMGLPGIFSSNSSRYPPCREKCAGPSCSNPYKYRDSKSNLPLCSLQCYKKVQPCS